MLLVDLQNASEISELPSKSQFEQWLEMALPSLDSDIELAIRITDEAEMTELNGAYRQKHKPTNVLAFPYDVSTENNMTLLGDIVICAPVVIKEAKAQNKPLESHWAHLTIHAALHLLGYDHIEPAQAEVMENIEIKLLEKLGYPNPYEQSPNNREESK